uniref:HEAT repeat domain-containing protein n=1 Tax=Caenorhabditis tropicalis TaxID=1561998 RepID=A0A1I7UBM1_9PELO
MQSYEIQINILARILQSGNSEAITKAINKFAQLPIPKDSAHLIDQANLPYLVSYHASDNEAAKELIQNHRDTKSIDLAKETPFVLQNFYEGIMQDAEHGFIPNHLVHLLTIMISFADSGYVRTSLRLLNELEFKMEDLEGLMPKLEEFQSEFPEAQRLIQKIEWKKIVEQMRNVRVSEWDEDTDVSFETTLYSESDFDETLTDESGIDSDEYDEDFDHYFIAASCEVHVNVLAELLKTEDSDLIDVGLMMVSQVDVPLEILRKFEIEALINEHALHNKGASNLLKGLQQMDSEKQAMNNFNTFRQIKNYIQSSKTISEPMMELLVNYMENENKAYVEHIAEVLVTKKVRVNDEQVGIKEYMKGHPAIGICV